MQGNRIDTAGTSWKSGTSGPRKLGLKGRGFSRGENAFLTLVIPSEEDRSLVNDLHSRETCFSRSLHDATLQETAGLSTPRSDSQTSRFIPLEMTECGTLHSTTKVLSPSGATANV